MTAPAAPTSLATARLVLRPWTLDDLPAFHALWGDPEVIFWGPSPDLAASREKLAGFLARGQGQPWPVGWHAVRLRETGETVGSAALQPSRWDAADLELGWHLMRAHWGRGFATEAAGALAAEALRCFPVPRLVCAILPANVRSQRVAARLGFRRYAENVLHAGLPHDLLELRRPTRGDGRAET